MAEWLIIIGLTALFTATLALVREAGHHGHSGLFFLLPFASLGQVQRHWQVYRFWALLRVVALLLALLGATLWWQEHRFELSQGGLQISQSGQVVRGDDGAHSTSFVSSQEAARLLSRGAEQPLAGRLQGRPFSYQRVSVVGGVLTASQGEGFYADLELRVLLNENLQNLKERRTWRVRPSDSEPPVLHVSWLAEGASLPETRIFEAGYSLELTLAPLDRHRMSGSLSLVLPDSFKSYLVGNFTANKNNLRYRGGQVDLTYDHADTLVYVVDQFLQTQFPEGALVGMEVEHVQLRRSRGVGNVQSTITLSNGAQQRRWVDVSKHNIGWVAHSSGMRVEELRPPRAGAPRIVEASPILPRREQQDQAVMPVAVIDFAQLAEQQGREVTLKRHQGRSLEGIIRRLEGQQLHFEERIGSGVVARTFTADSIHSVTLADGQQLRLATATSEAESATVPQAPVPVAPPVSSGPDPQSEPLAEYSALLGRRVVVVPISGTPREGVLNAVEGGKIRLAVPMGAGNVEYSYDVNTLQRIEARP